MDMINRSAIVVRPGQPFLDWLHRVDSTSAHLTLDDLQLEPTIYLLPECDSKEEALERIVKKELVPHWTSFQQLESCREVARAALAEREEA